MDKLQSISILGCGVVGTAVGTGLRGFGHDVIFYDIESQKIQELQRNGFDATLSIAEASEKSHASFICVPTPTNKGRIDLSYVKTVVKSLGKSLKKKRDYHLVVIKSTVIPTTTERIIVPILEKYAGKKVGEQLGICANPEFLTEIHHSWTASESFERRFSNEPLIVIGELDRKSGDLLQALYEEWKRPIIRTDLRTAETIKYAFNCALATRISYWNEIFYICKMLDVDSTIVAQAASLDERIGRYGTIHGKAFGGKCLPKDLEAFIRFSNDLGYRPKLLKAVEDINERIKSEKGVRE
jgi:UDPglucose 6-dehydrogenase